MRTYKLIFLGLLPLMLVMAGCGGGGSSLASGSGGSGGSGGGGPQNVAKLIVDAGPSPGGVSVNSVDIPYTTVTICTPGSSQCQTFDHIEVDTGSYGFRLVANATDTSGQPLSLSLPEETDTSGNLIAECTQFVDGYSWGPVVTADVDIGGESAASVPVQVIGDPSQTGQSSFPAVPTACSSIGTAEDTVATFGANGILGVGPFGSDCGSGCATGSNAANNGIYYVCPSGSSCVGSAVDTSAQVTNPVTYFTTDNNGVIVELPSVPSAGAPTVTGSLVFGIDTESNNSSSSARTVLTANNYGDVATQYNGQLLPYSVFDTGSNAYYFNDSSIPLCTDPNLTGWFCPTSTLSLSATNYAVDFSSGAVSGTANSTVTFYVGDVSTLFKNLNTAYDDIAGSSGDQSAYCPNGSSNCSFDFGLPFFFGRDVFVAISGANSSAGYGPYYAY